MLIRSLLTGKVNGKVGQMSSADKTKNETTRKIKLQTVEGRRCS